MKRKILMSLFLTMMLSYVGYAQHVIGFFPSWRNAGDENKIQYNKLTDIIYCFVQPNSSGQFPAFNTWSSTDQTKFNNIKTKAKANNVRVRISSGGAGSAYLYSPLAANATYRQNFATTVADFIVANDIDGFDIDWEFPQSSETGNLDLLVQAFRSAFDAKTNAGYRKIYLGIDVGGESGHTAYFSKNFVNYVDEVNIMAYDLAGGFSTVALSKTSFDIWKTYLGAANASKLVLGIPFYTVGGGNMYSSIASPYSTNGANAYNGTLSGSDGSTYNAAPAIKSKIDYVMQNGGGGVMIWELSQDILDASYYQYSLLSAINTAIKPYTGPTCTKPSMGGNKSLCGTGGSLTVSSGLTAQSYRTFTWYKNGVVIGGNTPSITVTAAGTYTVKVDSSSKCNTRDSIVVSATIGTVNLGSTVNLCTPATTTLDAGISGAGMNYEWSKDNTIIPGATNQTYLVRKAGTYKVVVSATGCPSVNGSVLITSSLPDVADVSRCGSGNVTLTVNNPGADVFEWYDAATAGNLLSTGSSYTYNASANKTIYIAKKLSNVGQNCVGIAAWDANTIYTNGMSAVYNNVKYTANWWSQNNQPDLNIGQWTSNGSCGSTGCDRSPVYVTVTTCTGIDGGNNNSELLIFPNPATSEVTISYPNTNSENISVSAISINGNHAHTLFNGLASNGNTNLHLNTSQLNPGVYILKITGNNTNFTSKLVIE